MLKIILIGQGSQTIQLIRQLFSLGITPDNLKIITVDGNFNKSCIEFLSYYKIYYNVCNKDNFESQTHLLISSFSPDMVISFSNPFILSEKIISLKTKFINFHPGILPNYKGSLSTVHSLINKEQFVGGTWHYIDKGIDTGNIIEVIRIPSKNLNAFTLNHKIFSLGINSIENVIDKVSKNYKGVIQKEDGLFYTNKFHDISKLDIELQKKISYFPPNFI